MPQLYLLSSSNPASLSKETPPPSFPYSSDNNPGLVLPEPLDLRDRIPIVAQEFPGVVLRWGDCAG